ncbi:MAG: YARHG domain-containing protein, partial [Cytophagales bacterium]|nr:YARHG domain-containing protein [Cytophaga sp.]
MSDHVTINDLDLMRNEIYAEYGLIFTSPKWQEYFSTKEWYKPLYTNVDARL